MDRIIGREVGEYEGVRYLLEEDGEIVGAIDITDLEDVCSHNDSIRLPSEGTATVRVQGLEKKTQAWLAEASKATGNGIRYDIVVIDQKLPRRYQINHLWLRDLQAPYRVIYRTIVPSDVE